MAAHSSLSSLRACLGAVAACLFVTSSAHAGRVWILQGPSSGIYPDIQSAVNAAVDGDVLVVLPDTYGAFWIDNKSVSLFAAGAGVQISGAVHVNNLAAEKTVILSGLSAAGALISEPGLQLVNNLGNVRLQSCTFTGWQGTNYTGSDGGHGAVLTGSIRVAFVRCQLRGGSGVNCQSCDGGSGGDGVVSTGSVVALYESVCIGGHGGSGFTYGGNGGYGYRATSNGLFASGSSFQGANGGDADDIPSYGGAGGDGLFVAAGAGAHLLANSYYYGIGGITHGYGIDGPPGQSVAGSGPIVYHSGPARLFDAATFLSDGGTRTVTVRGQPGEFVYLAASSRSNFRFLPALTGTLLFQPPFWVPDPLVATLPSSGTLDLHLPIPSLDAPSIGLVLEEQGFAIDPSSMPIVRTLGSPIYTLVLRRHAPPDCNGNGVSDYLDVIEGTSPDCNDNAVPDECDLASGTAADCNGNGAPDSCDIADGTSLDTNGNGIPDECEGHGPIWYVDANAPPGGDGSQANPFQTIRQGIAAANNGHTILVADGVYLGPDNRGLDMGSRNFTLKSQNGPSNCIIDCQGVTHAFFYNGYQTAASLLRGFTIRNGYDSNSGAGISINGCSPTIADCVLESCSARYYGGGIYIGGGASLVRNCTITGCSAAGYASAAGGGIYDYGSQATLLACTLSNNSAVLGGGIYLGANGDNHTTISNCRILENVASHSGGGVAVYTTYGQWHPRIVNCLIAGNMAGTSGGGIWGTTSGNSPTDLQVLDSTVVDNRATSWGGGIALQDMALGHLANTIVWANSAGSGLQVAVLGTSNLTVSYCDLLGGMSAVHVDPGAVLNWGAGNIAADPLFVDPNGPDGNPYTTADNDDHLGSMSPCTDAGDNTAVPAGATLDLDNLPRFVDDPAVVDTGNGSPPIVDMGAYERHP